MAMKSKDDVMAFYAEKNVHALLEDLLASAYQDRPEDLRRYWRAQLTKRIREDLGFKAVIFDLDGVVTKTAAVHSRAWKAMFDAFLRDRDGEAFDEFMPEDYLKYVDGRPRYEGVQTFLNSRAIALDMGEPSDLPDQEKVTCCSLGNRKNDYFMDVLAKEGVQEYPSTVRIMNELRDLGVRVGLASSSKNAKHVLHAAGLSHLIEHRVDGVVAAERGYRGKPAGDIFVECAKALGVAPEDAVVVEDATSGVAAGRAGKFRLVVGLAREGNHAELKEHGAHVVYDDFGDMTVDELGDIFKAQPKE
eukprot:TRINITY_DN24960_c0_g1_i1.p1 TRINITY_DN24960_c0_g1~~TRINITY_DN24960_c0_g1_i1.p1  ORF type:complete len:304 (+),score=133.82 TRINITY_DN24960_c0_g1_i1:76-987(+)